MINIYGSIGYTLLNNKQSKHNILVFADKHDNIPDCKNRIDMAKWFKTKFKSSVILLEEVPRVGNEILGLWETSKHTKELKDVYLENPSIIKPVDIRHFLVPFSWEVIDDSSEYQITLRKYLFHINKFFIMENEYLITNCPLYDVTRLQHLTLGRHFLNIKDEYYQLIQKLIKNKLLDSMIKNVREHSQIYLEKINDLISDIMEWYICACVEEHQDKPLLIHIGLAHSEKIINQLQNKYYYKIIREEGINKLNELSTKRINGCVSISKELNEQFGGFYN